jgi:hypothetical protein
MKYAVIFVVGLVIGCYTPPSLRDQVAGGLKTAAVAAVKAVGNSLKWAGNRLEEGHSEAPSGQDGMATAYQLSQGGA